MKHWSEFIPTQTQASKQLSKIAKTQAYEVQEKEIQLQNARANLERLEIKICGKIASNYTNEQDYENAILNAKEKANTWNNQPIKTHNPTHHNKK